MMGQVSPAASANPAASAAQTATSPISTASLTRLLGALRDQSAAPAAAPAPLITRAAHPAFRRQLPELVAKAVRDARAAQATAARRAAGSAAGGALQLIVPTNLSALLGLAVPTTPTVPTAPAVPRAPAATTEPAAPKVPAPADQP
ncbi:MAG: hypothetical protein M3Y77_03060 [Actinomycetota bacterium]|nr:hypothetical protein [Actinomycetota bacterium]